MRSFWTNAVTVAPVVIASPFLIIWAALSKLGGMREARTIARDFNGDRNAFNRARWYGKY